jgi:uncharacterized protein
MMNYTWLPTNLQKRRSLREILCHALQAVATALMSVGLAYSSLSLAAEPISTRKPYLPTQAEKIKVRALNQAGFDAYENNKLSVAYANYANAAKLGEPSALYNIAVMRIKDEVKQPSLKQAVRSLTRSAELGFAPAQFMLASLLETGLAIGIKNKSLPQSVRWFEKAAKQGHPDAFLALGTAYYIGRGTQLDYSRALEWYTKAAESGDVAAQYLVASMYETATGVEKNLETALMWYVAAARQGDIAAREKSKYLNEIIAKERQS